MQEQPDNKKQTRVIDLDAILNGPGVARYEKRLREQSGIFDTRLREQSGLFGERLQKQMAAAGRRAVEGVPGQVLGNRTRDAFKQISVDTRAQERLKQVSDQIGGQALNLQERLKEMGGALPGFAAQIERPTFDMDESLRQIGEAHARDKREAIEREIAMVNYLASLSRSFEQAAAHEAAALERAERAEKREQAAIARSEQIQRRSLWIAVAALAFTVISTTAAVLALFVA